MCRNERRKCKAACSAKIEIARLTLQWEFFHPLSTRMHRSRVFVYSIRFRVAIARSVLLSIHKFSLFPACVREKCVYTFTSPASKESSPSASTFSAWQRASERVVISIPCILFLFFPRFSLFLFLSFFSTSSLAISIFSFCNSTHGVSAPLYWRSVI